jgi:protein-tyrosine phosphatase
VDWVAEGVAVGNYLVAQDADLLREQGVRSVLCLDRTLQGRQAAELGLQAIEVVPLDDGPGNDPRLFRMAVDALTTLARENGPVLVQCHAGRSRSAVVAAGYLMRALGIEQEEALARVAQARDIAVSPGLERLLESLREGPPAPRLE